MTREEIECDVASIEPELGSLRGHPIHHVLGSRGAKRLKPVIRSEVERTSWVIDARNGHMRADLDSGAISAGARSEEFAELEFELLSGPPASLIVAARRISDHVPVRLGVLTKAERGLRLLSGANERITKAAPVDVRREMTVAEAFELIVHACLKHYRLNEPLVIRERKAAALHQCRVAMRRLRSAFTLFRPAVEDVEFQHLRHELRWFTAQLGDARNLDVYLERDLDHDERERLRHERERAYDGVADAMNSHKFRRLLIDIVGWAAIGAWRSGKLAARPIPGFADARLDKLWQSIAGAGRDVAGMDETSRHELRIQIKKLRYAIEFLRCLYPEAHDAEKHFAAAVEELQETLGKLNDLVTAKTLVGEPADDGWLIGSYEERRHLFAAEDALRALLRVGPFWRARQLEPV
jgi:inorganic triphosphatase YgiF